MEPMILASFWRTLAGTIFVVICILLMFVILIQRGRGGGLSSAFGGAGGHSAFGAKTGDVFTWITVVLAALFVVVACLLNFVFQPIAPTVAAPPPLTDQRPAAETDQELPEPAAPQPLTAPADQPQP